MSSAREEILARVRRGLADVGPDDRTPIPRAYARQVDEVDVPALFERRLAEYQAAVQRCGASQLPEVLAGQLRARGMHRVVLPADVPGEWTAGVADVEIVRDDPPLPVHELDQVDGVVTGCAAAIALTGTVVLDGSAAQGRRALTLVPDYHLCVVRAGQVSSSLPAAIGDLDPYRPLTFISGPSATSDIELDRVEGVHGPRTLDVLVVTG